MPPTPALSAQAALGAYEEAVSEGLADNYRRKLGLREWRPDADDALVQVGQPVNAVYMVVVDTVHNIVII